MLITAEQICVQERKREILKQQLKFCQNAARDSVGLKEIDTAVIKHI